MVEKETPPPYWNETPENEGEEVRLPTPLWKKLLRGAVALGLVAGLLYLSGPYQFNFLRRTPPEIEQTPLPAKVETAQLTIPVIIHILIGSPGSERTETDAHRLVKNANNIWSQANISFDIKEIRTITVTAKELQNFALQPHSYIQNSNSYQPEVANVYLTRTLQGVNGLAYTGTSAVSVADYTSTLDFRTLAHEFGHLLGLPHVSDSNQLMSVGNIGTNLTLEEINTARQRATEFKRE